MTMKSRWNIVLLLAGSLCLTRSASAFETWVVIVGINKYDSPQIAALKYPATDATAIRETLTDPQYGNLSADHVKLLTDEQATAANIRAAVSDFLATKVQPGDHVIVSLAGHGVTKGVGLEAKSYLLPTDVKGVSITALEASAIDLRVFANDLGKLPASQFVLFVDACREDPTPGRGVKGNLLSDVLSRNLQVTPQVKGQPAVAVTFFACSIGQRAYEDPEFKHGVFTYWILDGIRQAAIPTRPEGSVDMGRLSSYVGEKVKEWAKKTSEAGGFEVEQTPEMVNSELNGPVVLVQVKRNGNLPAMPLTASAPRGLFLTSPGNAQLTVNGAKISAGPVVQAPLRSGDNTVRVEAAGYAPSERSVRALAGYQPQITLQLQHEESSGAAPNSKAAELYARAQDAEAREQWEAATAGYQFVLQTDSKFAPAYERLAALQVRQGQPKEAITTLLKLREQTTPNVHTYCLLTSAYVAYAMQEAPNAKEESSGGNKKKSPGGIIGGLFGKKKKDPEEDKSGGADSGEFRVPSNVREAVGWARKSADEAVKLDATAPEALQALGFALVAADQKGSNRKVALEAFGKALFLNPHDATSSYGLGYALRIFGSLQKEKEARDEDLKRAVGTLKDAIAIRPNYYEAHRELAYCYHLLDDTRQARREYDTANANRGGAENRDEVAGLNVALSSLLQRAATESGGNPALVSAAEGYLGDAREFAPNLTTALRTLKMVGLGNNLTDFLDRPLRELYNKIPSLPGGLGLPNPSDILGKILH